MHQIKIYPHLLCDINFLFLAAILLCQTYDHASEVVRKFNVEKTQLTRTCILIYNHLCLPSSEI